MFVFVWKFNIFCKNTFNDQNAFEKKLGFGSKKGLLGTFGRPVGVENLIKKGTSFLNPPYRYLKIPF
jgi:hypothetical protein